MSLRSLYDGYASLDRGWRACLLASVVVAGELLLAAV
jgi:hypothetical protein